MPILGQLHLATLLFMFEPFVDKLLFLFSPVLGGSLFHSSKALKNQACLRGNSRLTSYMRSDAAVAVTNERTSEM
jgi:hypothetical protein